jgi:hypothetical protein
MTTALFTWFGISLIMGFVMIVITDEEITPSNYALCALIWPILTVIYFIGVMKETLKLYKK